MIILLRLTQYSWAPGQTVQLFTGHVVEFDEETDEILEEYPDRLTTIGVDHRSAEQLADLINAADGEDAEGDYPLAAYEHWQVLA